MSQHDDPEYEALYDVLIEELDLSDRAIEVVKRTGITTVGDCLDHFLRGGDAMIQTPFGFIHVMEGEVKEKLQEHGYWAFYEKYS